MRNLSQDQFWAAKYLGIGLIALVLLALLTRLPEFLTSTPVEALLAIEPVVYLLILPLFVLSAVRSQHCSFACTHRAELCSHNGAHHHRHLLEGTALAGIT